MMGGKMIMRRHEGRWQQTRELWQDARAEGQGLERQMVVVQVLPSHSRWQTWPPPEPTWRLKSFIPTRSRPWNW
jgi:hypothetical protein